MTAKETIRRHEIVRNIASVTGFKIKDIDNILDLFFYAVLDAIKDNKKVVVPNFGAFYPYETKKGTIINIKTKEPIKYSSKKTMKFKISPNARKCINSDVLHNSH
ncbi:HU family DNA-binding protein [Nitrosophilus labii]|uniref:HU family DNA-binding protein n=1 Tax=Nitrosophilus labii TaxID=2706014 RepID=UPI0016570AC8|nr:HU family DNA-binding protein [Nitrosophilus labii]